jgi:hypothetical protein
MQRKLRKAVDFVSDKKIAAVMAGMLVISLIPILYLAGYARPSGDDYGYSVYTHAAWLDTHSLVEVFKAAVYTVKGMYRAWNGDWFTVFLFSLMPEVFAPYTFWIVPYFMVGVTVLGTTAFLYDVLVKTVGIGKEYAVILDALLLIASFQFIPSTAIGMYWYVGAMHYMVPHAVALYALIFGFRYYRTGKIRNIVYASLCMFMVGGSSYFSSLLVFMVYGLLMVLFFRKRKDIFYLLVPFLIGAAGFVVQCVSPGNKARGGESFGLSVGGAFLTVLQSLWQGLVTPAVYLREKTFIFVILLLCAVFGWTALLKRKGNFRFRYPLLFVVFMYGVYSAMYAPAIYAAVDVSLGPDTMVYLTFLLAALFSILYVEGWIIQKLREKENGQLGKILLDAGSYRCRAGVPLILLAAVLTLFSAGSLRNCVDKQVYDYVSSGQAEDFRKQIESQMEILLDDSIKEAYLVPINDQQGPLMHMPVTEDEEAFTNRVVRDFYRKDKVVMITNP